MCLALTACPDDDRNDQQGTFTTTLTTAGTDGGGSGTDSDPSATGTAEKFDMGGADSTADGTADTGEECASVSETANVGLQPADIIVVVDNSGSMDAEAGFVQTNMNVFSSQIFLANIDAHVVLISADSNSGAGICLAQPLGSGACPVDDKPPSYVHIADGVGSSNALQKILEHYPTWSQTMRPTAAKHIIVVTDDDSDLDSTSFDTMFKALDPSHAGYKFHAIASPEDPIIACLAQTTCCPALPLSAALSQEYIELTALTGGIFGNLCEQDFGPVFTQVSTAVVSGATLACEYPIPPPPEGEDFDPDKVNVEFDDGQGGTLSIGRVDSAADCPDVIDGWYYDDPATPTSIIVCDQTCNTIQGFSMASIDIQFGCATVDAPPVG
jgi:hypothetical protein